MNRSKSSPPSDLQWHFATGIGDIVDVIKIREVSIKGKRHKINIYEVLRIIEND